MPALRAESPEVASLEPSAAAVHPDRTRRSVLSGLLALNALMLTAAAVLLWASRSAEIDDAQRQALGSARLTEQVASAHFDEAAIALGVVAAQIGRALAGPGIEHSTLGSLVDEQVARVPGIERIGVFDARGAQVCGIPADRCRHLDVSDRDFFRRLREHPDTGPGLYGPHASRPDGRPALLLAQPIRSADGRFAGLALAELPIERLRPLVTLPHVGPQGTVTLRTAELDLVLREPELTGPEAAAAGRRVADELRAAIRSAPAEGVYRAVTPSDGIERLTAYRRLARHPYYVLVGHATGDFLATWRSLAAWTALFLMLFAGASWQLARTTSTSLRRQALAQRLYDEAPCGYHTLGPDGVYLSVNATELRWLGCTREQVGGRLRPSDFYTDEGRRQFATRFPTLAQGAALRGLDLDLVGRDGTVRHVLVDADPVMDAGGRFALINSVMYDITALHQARTRLRALAQEQGVMLDNDLIGIVRLAGRRVTWKNQAMDRIFGYAGAAWQDMPLRTLFPDDEGGRRAGDESEAAMAGGLTWRAQLPMRRADGSAVWIDASGTRLSEETGEAMLLLADISALKSAEEARVRAAELQAQNFQLRELDRLKNEFVSNMSHELRTPLHAVLGLGQLLQSGAFAPGSPQHGAGVDQLVASGRQLLALIDQVLDNAAAEAGRLAFTPAPLAVAGALQEVADALRAAASARDIPVEVEVEAGLGTVMADPLRLRQMLVALLGNAIKFSPPGGRVALRARGVDAARWQVEVCDHGIGIAEADLPRIFSPFVQLSAGATKAYEGTGIGLALVRQLAVAQGGQIEVRSRPGEGSTFTLVLPRVPAPAGGDAPQGGAGAA